MRINIPIRFEDHERMICDGVPVEIYPIDEYQQKGLLSKERPLIASWSTVVYPTQVDEEYGLTDITEAERVIVTGDGYNLNQTYICADIGREELPEILDEAGFEGLFAKGSWCRLVDGAPMERDNGKLVRESKYLPMEDIIWEFPELDEFFNEMSTAHDYGDNDFYLYPETLSAALEAAGEIEETGMER